MLKLESHKLHQHATVPKWYALDFTCCIWSSVFHQ